MDLVVLTEQVSVALKTFSSFFGGGGATRNPNAPRQGDDLQYAVNLKFEEAIFGVEREVSYNREATCRTCTGSGAKPNKSSNLWALSWFWSDQCGHPNSTWDHAPSNDL